MINTRETQIERSKVGVNTRPNYVLCLTTIVIWLITAGLCEANTMIHNSTNLGSTKHDGLWGVVGGKYGEFTCGTCHERNSGNIKRIKKSLSAPNEVDSFPIESDAGTVLFNSVTGPESFGDDAGGHTTSERICEVCHSLNAYHNYSSAINTGGLNHENQKDCTTCHKHSKSFGASCDACHGNPPITANLDNTGLVFDPSATGATNPASPGAHELHAVTEEMSCTTCHKGNTMPTVSMTVQMGFEANSGNWSQLVGSVAGGNIDAPLNSAMLNGYEFVASDGGETTITKVATHDLNCTVYCHGNWTGSGGSNTTPSWVGGSSQAVCGTCHGATPANPPTAGSHERHAGTGTGEYNLDCTRCHPNVTDQTHLNGSVSWALDTGYNRFGTAATYAGSASSSTGSVAPSAGYGQCDNIYCHSSGQGLSDPTEPPVYNAVTWGEPFSGTCTGACHNVGYAHLDRSASYPVLSSGSHAKHLNYHFFQDGNCQSCHHDYAYATCDDCHARSGHVDHSITVNINPEFPAAATSTSGSYNGSVLPGDAYGDCSNIYCHSPGTKVDAPYADPNTTTYSWGGASLPTDCTGCHSGDASAARTIVTASHDEHLGKNIDCSRCHEQTVADSRTLNPTLLPGNKPSGYYYHSNGWVNIAFDDFSDPDPYPVVDPDPDATYAGNVTGFYPGRTPGSTPGTCENVYCHSSAQGITVPTDPPIYNTPTWGGTIASRCKACHNSGAHLPLDPVADPPMSSGSHSKHVEYAFSGSPVSCQACHWLEETLACTPCHISTGPTTFVRLDKHVNGAVDVNFNPAAAGISATYTGDDVPRTDYGSCENTYCHSNGTSVATGVIPVQTTADWGSGALSCSACHEGPTTGPTYANTTPKANSHAAHSSYDCVQCHSATVDASDAIIDKTVHANLNYDVSGTDITSYTFDNGGGTCNNVACHADQSPVWGGIVNCGGCHAVNNTLPPSHNTHYGVATTGDSTSEAKINNTSVYVYQCGSCHDNVPHADGNKDVKMSANWGGTENSLQCSNVYCHSDGVNAAGNVAPTWATTSMTCNSCHDTEPSSGDHTTHVDATYDFNCNECHNVTTSDGTSIADTFVHVDKTKDVDISANYDGNGGTGNWDGTNCSSVYCHSDGKATPTYATVVAGSGPADCVFCHGGTGVLTGNAGEPLSASHAVHTGTNDTSQFAYTCNDCHDQTAGSNSAISNFGNHVNKVRDVAVSIVNGGTGSIGGDFNGTGCTTTNCHGSNSAGANDSWASGGTTGDCSFCHGMSDSGKTGRDTAGDTEVNDIEVGAHVAHLNSTNNYTSDIRCDECHIDPKATVGTYVEQVSTANHMNGTAERTWGTLASTDSATTSYTSGNCSNYCHGDTLAGGVDPTPLWADPGYLTGSISATGDCNRCHGAPPNTSDHNNENLSECGGCHGDTMNIGAATFKDVSKHVDGTVQATCTGCHGATSPDAGVGTTSAHLDWNGDGTDDDCTACHPGGIEGGMHVKGTSNKVVTIANKTTVGINYVNGTNGYKGDNGILLGGDSTISSPGSEAEICWGCHSGLGTPVSEWGTNTGGNYDYGSVTTANWFSADWSSANFDYKNGKLLGTLSVDILNGRNASAHNTTGTPSDHDTSMNGNGVGTVDTVGCSYCHDVHDNNKLTGDSGTGGPHLRGSWLASAYYEDGAPGRYTGGIGGTEATNSSGTTAYDTTVYGAVPRGNDATNNGMGGYWIDQNSASHGAASYADHAGLCTLCHGDGDAIASEVTDVTAIEALWAGHINPVAGGSNSTDGVRNIFDPDDRSTVNSRFDPNMGYQNSDLTTTYVTKNNGTKWMGGLRETDSGAGIGVTPSVNGQAFGYQSGNFVWGVDSSTTAPQTGYHNFTCSKCHNPHASRLPKLMITNCLDVERNVWDAAYTGDSNWSNWGNLTPASGEGNKELAYANSAQNCHRYYDRNDNGDGADTGEEDGWNSITPW